MATKRLIEELHSLGFDRSKAVPFQKAARLGCSQCEALAINGVATHEQGCPNRVPRCGECGNPDPDGTCCQPSEEDEDTCGSCSGSPRNVIGCLACCRDCGFPCSAEKDGEGFHAEEEEEEDAGDDRGPLSRKAEFEEE